MLNVEIDRSQKVILLEPASQLSKGDFEEAIKVIDPFLESEGEANGVIINARHFPGWDSFSALIRHLRFIKNRHQRVQRVAVVTDSPIGNLLEVAARHFVSAEVARFTYGEFTEAREWVEPDAVILSDKERDTEDTAR